MRSETGAIFKYYISNYRLSKEKTSKIFIHKHEKIRKNKKKAKKIKKCQNLTLKRYIYYDFKRIKIAMPNKINTIPTTISKIFKIFPKLKPSSVLEVTLPTVVEGLLLELEEEPVVAVFWIEFDCSIFVFSSSAKFILIFVAKQVLVEKVRNIIKRMKIYLVNFDILKPPIKL